MIDYENRLNQVRQQLKHKDLDALIVSESHNIFYLSGSNSGYTGAKVSLVVDGNRSVLIVDKRYYDEALENSYANQVVAWTKSSYSELVDIIRDIGAKRVGFESAYVTVRQHERMSEEFGEIELVGVTSLVEQVREVKDKYEIKRITDAASIADSAFDHIVKYLKPGLEEIDIGIELDYYMRSNGAEGVSFDTIVASGKHSAVPHSTISRRKLETGDFVTLDFGAVAGGYHSDMTRTVVIGTASQDQKMVYNAVKEAQETSLNSVAPGAICQDIDTIARSIITRAGYGENFVHNLGHGVGLNVHELPVLAKGSETKLKTNMVVTVEPGIYISGFGGVRIEDLAVVTGTGYKVLSHSTKELLEL